MRVTFASIKDRYVLTVSILLIVAVLVVGGAACDGAGARTYQLTVSSGPGGNVTSPGEGTFTYDAGMLIPLTAMPDDGYQFASWTGDVTYVANSDAAYTTITMNGNYAIVANFETEDGTGPNGGGPTQP